MGSLSKKFQSEQKLSLFLEIWVKTTKKLVLVVTN